MLLLVINKLFSPGEAICNDYQVCSSWLSLASTSTGLLSLCDLLLKRQFWHKQFDKGIVAVGALSENMVIS